MHGGWLVKTARHVLVFDYVESHPSGARLPDRPRLNPGSFDRRPVVVFASHGHADHVFPRLGSWASQQVVAPVRTGQAFRFEGGPLLAE